MIDLQNDNWLRPLIQAWREKKRRADDARKNWLEVARECRRFYAGPTSWMWDDEHRGKVWGDGVPIPTFKMTVNRAFEFVAIYLPYLWANLPHRNVEPKRDFQFDPTLLFGPPPEMPPQLQQAQQNPQAQQDPQFQQAMQQFQMTAQQYQQQMNQFQQQEQMERSTDAARAELMMRWLNYTTGEMPHGGLNRHGELCCLDALITGRGVLWPAPYRMPGSERTLTGTFWRPVTDFFTDPDYDTWQDGTFIMRETTEDVAKCEKRFGLPPGALRNRGTMESNKSFAERAGDYRNSSDRDRNKTKDKITYTEVWSKAGVGCRWTAMKPELRDYLDRVVGEYAYIAFSDEVPFPLNAPPDAFKRQSSDDQIKNLFRWDVPYWADNRWPCAVLDFYSDIQLKEEGDSQKDRTKFKGWPVAPMGPGLGELKFINAATSFLLNRIVSSCRDFWAVAKPAYDELIEALESGSDQNVIPINRIHGKISDVLTIVQQPETRRDLWQIIESVSGMLDKRWHLNALMYGMSGPTQERSATEVVEKRQAMNIVPEYMATKVEDQQTDAATLEAFATAFYVKAKDVLPIFGQGGAMLWQQLIENGDPELVMRQMNYVIASGTIRRANKDRDVANVNSMLQTFGPIFQQYFGATGDPTPINASMRIWGKSSDADVSEVQLKPPPPPQPPPPDPAEQQKMEMEMQKSQADLQLKQLDMQAKQMDMQAKQQQAGMKMQGDQQRMQLDVAKANMDLQQDQQEFAQDLQQDQQSHIQELLQGRQKHVQELEILEEKSKAQVAAVKAVAKAKPTSNGNGRQK